MRRGVLRLALAAAGLSAAAILVGALGATAAVAAPPPPTNSCGDLLRYDTYIGVRDTSCGTGRRIGLRYLLSVDRPNGKFPRQELGFRCRRIPINAAAGWYGLCRKGRALVTIVPE